MNRLHSPPIVRNDIINNKSNMNWKLLARHIRKCPKCENNICRKYKNRWSKDIKFLGKTSIGMECKNKDCDFFITHQKLKEIAPTKNQLKARRVTKKVT